MSGWAGMEFASPEWVHALWLVLAYVVVLLWLDKRGNRAIDRFVSPRMQDKLVRRTGSGQQMLRVVLLGVAGASLILALMRPQWGTELVEEQRAGAEIMICLDVSRSMLAEDVAPNRLDRAKAEIRDLLGLLGGDQVGLIAFAGRASVLSPMTPDFSFLHLVLSDASPRSVNRGGTRLEEPIRKAIAGFGDSRDVSRTIVIITDGEDHDSFPMAAAREAAERGIHIIAIGFGDESGATIPITDPETGARQLLRDGDGKVVESRLDGDLLREMALATDGAYIPAGTGVLDLQAIYRRHIAPLTRGELGERARVVKKDGFQWAVLLAMLCLLGAVWSTAKARSSNPNRETGTGLVPGVTLVVVSGLLVWGLSTTTQAQTTPGSAPNGSAPSSAPVATTTDTPEDLSPRNGADTTSPGSEGDTPQGASAESDIRRDPRAAYNEGLAALQRDDPALAARELESAHAGAGTDAETRFRATYNLGWTEVTLADGKLESAPQEALDHLRRAAAWFREALELRPGHDDSRYNFEIVMRRALELADAIAKSDESDLETTLDTLINAQRDFLHRLRGATATQSESATAQVRDSLRRQFRSLAASELTILTDAEAAGEKAVQELNTLTSKPQDERSPEENLQVAQLNAVLKHVHEARERIGQARTRLRRIQGEAAYRRAAAALGALHRARDQLRDPVARLDALIATANELGQLTATRTALARSKAMLAAGSVNGGASPGATAPDWLSDGYLGESQHRLNERTKELHDGLTAALARTDSQSASTPEPDAAASKKLMEQVRLATPLIGQALTHFNGAHDALLAPDFPAALNHQGQGLEALGNAREAFLDLSRLIELTHAEERRVAALLAPAGSTPASTAHPAPPADERSTRLDVSATIQRRNLQRADRLATMLTDAMLEAKQQPDPGSAGNPGASPGAPPAASGVQQPDPHEQGYALLRQAQVAMHATDQTLASLAETSDDESIETGISAARTTADKAVAALAELRRLFFSVLEHLRDTAQRQQRLADDTESVAALHPAPAVPEPHKVGPLNHRQANLGEFAAGLGDALRAQAQAQAAAGTSPQGPQPGAPPQGGPPPESWKQAATLTDTAAAAMREAATTLRPESLDLDAVRSKQDEALKALVEALALFDQPHEPSDGSEQQENNDSGSSSDQNEEQQPAQDNPGESDLAQLLQGVRDREAERREAQARQANRGQYEPVEKDW